MAIRNISIDPGTNHTGYCVWEWGKPIECSVFNAPRRLLFVEKLLWHKAQLSSLFVRIVGTNNIIDRIAVEQFEVRNNRMEHATSRQLEKVSMMKCGAVQGMCFSLADDWAKAELVSKRTITKAQSALLARRYGIFTESKDAIDAFQIGICAGFDKRGIYGGNTEGTDRDFEGIEASQETAREKSRAKKVRHL